jgi:hypothetical protein
VLYVGLELLLYKSLVTLPFEIVLSCCEEGSTGGETNLDLGFDVALLRDGRLPVLTVNLVLLMKSFSKIGLSDRMIEICGWKVLRCLLYSISCMLVRLNSGRSVRRSANKTLSV